MWRWFSIKALVVTAAVVVPLVVALACGGSGEPRDASTPTVTPTPATEASTELVCYNLFAEFFCDLPPEPSLYGQSNTLDPGLGDRPPFFTDVTDVAGIDFLYHDPPTEIFNFGAGVIIFDYNSDGFDDIFVPDSLGPNALYRSNGNGTFTDVAKTVGVDDPLSLGNGGCAADYDNDGNQDLYLSNYGGSKLFHNDGDAFTDVTSAAGVDDSRTLGPFNGTSHRAMGCAWGDYDNDGLLDLVVVRHMIEIPDLLSKIEFYDAVDHMALFHNKGDGTFTNVTSLLGDPSPIPDRFAVDFDSVWGAGFQPAWVDFDNDGDVDLSVSNDMGMWIHPNVLWRNDGPADDGTWRLTDVSVESGTDIPMYGMSMTVGDYNVDGFLDFFITNIGRHVLLRNEGDGTFTNTTKEAGVGMGLIGIEQRVSWGAVFFDYDNDGYEDLYVVSGFLKFIPNPEEQHNVLMWNKGDGTFIDVTPISGADDPGIGRGGAYLDFNGDGCLDLFIANLGQQTKLFENACDSGKNWLTINTVGTASNRDGIGTRITVDSGGTTQIREISSGGSHMGQNMRGAHFGLGAAATVDSVTIRWPSGRVQTLTDVAANQRLTVTEPQ